ncbi:glycerophosphodiester phosphodiesterase family protein [Actinomyces faecalis]|uniref:glycerophosphodiester phosphodiesterase family protein n=1 Tax=Actinomyces faecalis TaxID=2722820 RepID=UPI001551C17B|nr:glycerophosphodiester phosphodiesterase family protein [Actinomyces faecalis]
MSDNILVRRRQQAGRALVATHRGTAGGLVYPNTLAAAQLALVSGSDIVELDVVRTRDGQYVTFHDGYESTLLGASRSLTDMSATEVQAQRYGRFQTNAGVAPVEAYRDVVGALPEVVVNVDRSYRYWELGFLDELATWADPALMVLKSPVRDTCLRALAECETAFPFIPIVRSEEEIDRVRAWEGINLIGLEVLAERPDDRLADAGYLAGLKAQGLLIWLNAINLEDGWDRYCGWDDLTSLRQDPDQGWGRLVRQGADVIQTDYPWLLRPYLEARQA